MGLWIRFCKSKLSYELCKSTIYKMVFKIRFCIREREKNFWCGKPQRFTKKNRPLKNLERERNHKQWTRRMLSHNNLEIVLLLLLFKF